MILPLTHRVHESTTKAVDGPVAASVARRGGSFPYAAHEVEAHGNGGIPYAVHEVEGRGACVSSRRTGLAPAATLVDLYLSPYGTV